MKKNHAMLAGIMTVVTAAAGALVLTAGPAAAAPRCEETNVDKSCVAVTYRTDTVKSVRVEGQCLWGVSGHYPGARVWTDSFPDVQTYTGTKCEGNTRNSAPYGWTNEDGAGYRWLMIG